MEKEIDCPPAKEISLFDKISYIFYSLSYVFMGVLLASGAPFLIVVAFIFFLIFVYLDLSTQKVKINLHYWEGRVEELKYITELKDNEVD